MEKDFSFVSDPSPEYRKRSGELCVSATFIKIRSDSEISETCLGGIRNDTEYSPEYERIMCGDTEWSSVDETDRSRLRY